MGDRLLVANQDSRDIVVLDLDVEAGRAEFVATVPVPSPVCLVQIER
ncbi:beta-propeller fold lactonase family protein [Priestia megaterium]